MCENANSKSVGKVQKSLQNFANFLQQRVQLYKSLDSQIYFYFPQSTQLGEGLFCLIPSWIYGGNCAGAAIIVFLCPNGWEKYQFSDCIEGRNVLFVTE
jgi:hypothetical protein